jgi:uncharacterized protein (TIGR02996 family)
MPFSYQLLTFSGRPMDQREAFLQAIVESPADDLPRLVYADWLEEHGEADRAEFIRVQIELASLNEGQPRWAELRGREIDLQAKQWRNWPKELPGWVRKHAEFRRGFIAAVSGTVKQFLVDGERIRRLVPLEKLCIERVDNLAPALFASPLLAGLTYLYVQRLDPSGAADLAASPQVASLTTLNLRQGSIGPSGAQALAASPHLARLTRLYICRSDIGDEGAKAVADSPYFRRLVELELLGNDIGPDGARALAASPNVARLTDLNLQANRLGDKGTAELGGSPYLKHLVNLNLSYNEMSEAGAQALAGWKRLTNVRTLELDGNRITLAGATALAASPYAKQLTRLERFPRRCSERRGSSPPGQARRPAKTLHQCGNRSSHRQPRRPEVRR